MPTVQTVTGVMDAANMGFTLPHEHIFWDLSLYLPEHPDPTPICPEIYGELKYHLWDYSDNVVQQDPALAVRELRWFKEAGGGTICDNSCHGLSADPVMIRRVSEETGVPVILGTGCYFAQLLPAELQEMDEDRLAELYVRELTEGVGDTGVKCGFIGEIGVLTADWEHTRRFLAAAAMAQKQTGAAITIHQPGTEQRAEDIFKVLTDHGADLQKVIMCHCDPYLPDHDYLDNMAKAGANLSFDFFGLEAVLAGVLWLPTDKDRILAAAEQIARGNLNKIVFSHDTANKSMLRTYGGFGYAHLQKHLLPLMEGLGVTKEQQKIITEDNPQRIFGR